MSLSNCVGLLTSLVLSAPLAKATTGQTGDRLSSSSSPTLAFFDMVTMDLRGDVAVIGVTYI